MKKKIYFFIIITIYIISCTNNLQHNKTWINYKNKETKNRIYEPTLIKVIEQKTQNKITDKLSLSFLYKDNKFYLTDGIYNNFIKVNETHQGVVRIIKLLMESQERESFFFSRNIKCKIYATNRTKYINGTKCQSFKFKNEIFDNNKIKSKETGFCWIDLNTSNVILINYKIKLPWQSSLFLPTRNVIKIHYYYKNNIIESTQIDGYFIILIPKFGIKSKINITYTDYEKIKE